MIDLWDNVKAFYYDSNTNTVSDIETAYAVYNFAAMFNVKFLSFVRRETITIKNNRYRIFYVDDYRSVLNKRMSVMKNNKQFIKGSYLVLGVEDEEHDRSLTDEEFEQVKSSIFRTSIYDSTTRRTIDDSLVLVLDGYENPSHFIVKDNIGNTLLN